MKRGFDKHGDAHSGLVIKPINLSRPKLAQQTMGIPFGLIFAIFLIVVFIVIAFIAVRHFLDIGSCSETGLFYDSLQKKVNEALSSQLSDFKFDINLPSGIQKVCFGNLSADITNTEDYGI